MCLLDIKVLTQQAKVAGAQVIFHGKALDTK